MTTNGKISNGVSPDSTQFMDLCLHISDATLMHELSTKDEGEQRHDFAVAALNIGVLALRQAQGRIDRQEGDRLLERVSVELDSHRNRVTEQIGSCLTTYFHPESGQFSQRVQRLVAQDGELEKVLRSHIEGEGSPLAKTLKDHVGSGSPLMQILDTDSKDGLASTLTAGIETVCKEQNEYILKEFSADNTDGALSRLLRELTVKNGDLEKALGERVGVVVAEFSLDKEDSALSRLMARVEATQRKISNEFSLDQEDSGFARMRKQLLDIIEKQGADNQTHHKEVIRMLTDMVARKQESERSTQHGLEFEDAVWEFVSSQAQKVGDIPDRTGGKPGLIQRNKKGDAVVQLGSEQAAAGAKIVIEAKENKSYTLQQALEEMEEARKNRGAGVGVFVFSAKTAPDGLEPLKRYQNDVLIVWDSEDQSTDVVFEASLSVARALCTKAATYSDNIEEDLDSIEKAILAVERQAEEMDQIKTWATTIANNSDKIVKSVDKTRGTLDTQVAILNEKIAGLKSVVVDSP